MFKKYKIPVFIGSLILIIIILVMLIIQHLTKKEEILNLSNLIETPYEILAINRNTKSEPYEVILTGDLEYTDQILLATKMQKQITEVEKLKNHPIHLHLYDKETTLKDIADKELLAHPQYQYTLNIEGSNIIKYTALKFENITPNLMASKDWRIIDSHFNDESELIYKVSMTPDIEMDTLFATLKGIQEEMIHYNFKSNEKAIVKQKVELSETESYYHISTLDDYLIQKLVLIGKGE